MLRIIRFRFKFLKNISVKWLRQKMRNDSIYTKLMCFHPIINYLTDHDTVEDT